MSLEVDASFMPRGACAGVDPELMFPERGDITQVQEAKKVCKGCVVRDECREYALANCLRNGVYGGLSEQERRRIRRERKLAAVNAASV